jgi:SAM-dependent methyltransferase
VSGALWWVESRAEQLLLELRELLVRHDENLKANTLMQECVPFFLQEDHPLVDQARAAQAAMVEHITAGPDAYQAYYSTNEHEKPFEEQYGIEAADAHKHLPRLQLLRSALEEKRVLPADGKLPLLLDCACNDGWVGVNLRGLVDYHGLDLNPSCVERAKARHIRRARFACGEIRDAPELTAEFRPAEGYDVVVCFECLEHVPDPQETMSALAALVRPGGRMFLSTPAGAVEGGDLPQWWLVEPKGHVRVFTPATFLELLEPWGNVDGIVLGPDQVMVARVTVPA